MVRILHIALIVIWGMHSVCALPGARMPPRNLAPRSELDDLTQMSLADLRGLMPDVYFPSGRAVSFEAFHNAVQRDARRLVSKSFLGTWLEELIANNEVVRVFRPGEGRADGAVEERFMINDAWLSNREWLWAFLPEKDVPEGAPPLLERDRGVGGRLGRVFAEQYHEHYGQNVPICRAVDRCNDYVLNRARIVHRYRDRMKAVSESEEREAIFRELQVFLEAADAFGNRIDSIRDPHQSESAEALQRIYRAFRVANRISHYRAGITALVAAMLREEPVDSPLRTELIERLEQNWSIGRLNLQNIMNRAARILEVPYHPRNIRGESLQGRDYFRLAFQNYQHTKIQECISTEREPAPDILLLALASRLESVIESPLPSGDVFEREMEQAVLFAERLGLNEIADDYRDVLFRQARPEIYRYLSGELLPDVFRMSARDLQRYLRGNIYSKVEKALLPFQAKYRFQVHSRLKSHHSIWEKLKSLKRKRLEKERGKPVSLDEVELEPGVDPLEEDLRNNIQDLFGLQVVFEIPKTVRDEQNLKRIQREILDAIQHEFSQWKKTGADDAEQGEVAGQERFETREKWLGSYGYQEFKIIPRWKKVIEGATVEMKAEIQVMSHIDYAHYRYGPKAHWEYKARSRGYRADSDLLARLPERFNGDYHHDFNVLYNELDEDVYTTVLLEGEDGYYLQYLRLPRGALPCDAASSRTVNRLNERYTGALSLERLHADQEGRLRAVLDEVKTRDEFLPIRPGEILYFPNQGGPKAVFEKEQLRREMLERARKTRTRLLALLGNIPVSEREQIRDVGEAALRPVLEQRLSGDPAYLEDAATLQRLLDAAVAKFRLESVFELYLLAGMIAEQRDHRPLFESVTRQFFEKSLGMRGVASREDLARLMKIDSKDVDEIDCLARFIVAEQVGTARVEKQFAGAGESFFRDVMDVSTRTPLEFIARKLGMNNLAQLYQRVGMNVLSLEELLLRYYQSRGQEYRVTLGFKNLYPSRMEILKAIEGVGGIPYPRTFAKVPMDKKVALTVFVPQEGPLRKVQLKNRIRNRAELARTPLGIDIRPIFETVPVRITIRPPTRKAMRSMDPAMLLKSRQETLAEAFAAVLQKLRLPWGSESSRSGKPLVLWTRFPKIAHVKAVNLKKMLIREMAGLGFGELPSLEDEAVFEGVTEPFGQEDFPVLARLVRVEFSGEKARAARIVKSAA